MDSNTQQSKNTQQQFIAASKQQQKEHNIELYSSAHWDTAYIDNKFYVAHPLALDKLLKLQKEIKKQKSKLNMPDHSLEQKKQDNSRDHSLISQINNPRPDSSISRSCKTQINPLKDLKSKIKVQSQLFEQEEKNRQRVDQLRKKKQSKQTQQIIKDVKSSGKRSEKQSQKNDFQSGVIIPHELSMNKKDEGNTQKKQDSAAPVQKSKPKKKSIIQQSKISQKQPHQNPQKNYISFHPDEAIVSPRFLYNKDKSSKKSEILVEHIKQLPQKQDLRKSSISASRNATKSFVINYRKPTSVSKDAKQHSSNNRKNLKSASSATSKIQLQILNKKIKQMQEKLAIVQNKQKQFQAMQQSRVQAYNSKSINQNTVQQNLQPQKQKSQQSQKVDSISIPKEYIVQKNRKNSQSKIKQISTEINQQEKTKNIQKSLLLERKLLQNQSSNKSEYINDRENVGNQLQFDLTLHRQKKLNISSQTVAYNYTQDLLKLKKQMQQQNQKQMMMMQINELKKMIRQLKLQRIQHQSIIQQFQKRQKEKQSINLLLNIKLDQKTPQISRVTNKLPTQKRQKTEPKQEEQNDFRALHKKQSSKNTQQNITLPKIDSSESPLSKRQKMQSLKFQTKNNLKLTQKLSNSVKGKKQLSTKTNKQGINISNPQQASYRQFHPASLGRRGIIVRQVMNTEKDEIIQSQSQNKYYQRQMSPKDCDYEPPSPVSTGRKIFQLQFIKETKKRVETSQKEQIQIKIPNIIVQGFKIPKLPETPAVGISQSQLMTLAKKICEIFQIRVDSDEQLYLKKYKNCIIFKTPDPKKSVVWHYSGKFYIGGWDQNQLGQGKKNGEGFEYVPQKHYYNGQFLQGKKNGSGIMMMANGNIYKGQWVKGLKHGQGSYIEKSTGIAYEGEWKQDRKEGKGVIKFSDKQFYDGTFVKSIKQGYGYQVFANGDMYRGQYKVGRFHGKGRYVWANGASFDGNFIDGNREGMGRWKSSKRNYDVYSGEYKNDKKSGKGQYIWNNGCIFDGYFLNDLKHGQGRVEYPDGRQIRGHWQSGKLIQVDQNITQSQISTHRNQPLQKPEGNKMYEISSKQLQNSKNLSKF